MKRSVLLVVLIGAFLTGCTIGPDYRKPATDIPPTWRFEAPWQQSNPSDAMIKGDWWEVFGDSQLNQLEKLAVTQSQTLRIAAARLDQARAVVRSNTAALFPELDVSVAAARQKISANRPLSNYSTANNSTVQNDIKLNFVVSYEADFLGRVRRAVEGAHASAEQAQADWENTRLLLTAQLASDYFNLRELDTEIDVVSKSIKLQERALAFVTARHDLGAASGLDVAQQQTLLDGTKTQLELLRNQRAQYEHAIATLIGTPAPSFAISPATLTVTPPPIPVDLPSTILERRPDVASVERAMMAANAQIGVASAAVFPAVFLSPNVGWESTSFSNLLNASSVLWSFGVSATQAVFDAGKRRASIDFAEAGYSATVANYRQTVLTAMQEVQNGIIGLSTLERASKTANAALSSAQRLLDLANDRYAGGLANYLDVITAQQALLNNQRQSVQILGQRLLMSVYLVKALGGTWHSPS